MNSGDDLLFGDAGTNDYCDGGSGNDQEVDVGTGQTCEIDNDIEGVVAL